jgi:aminoglycoside phosphotransferase (APT) family kinase protein
VEARELSRIAEGLVRAFPDLGVVVPIRLLGSGFDSVAVEVSGGRVFRVARNQPAAAGQARELRLLPELRPHVPVPIPDPGWYADACPHFPFGVIGYPKIEGTALSPALLAQGDLAAIAGGLAAFLAALHRFRPERAEALGVPGPSARRAQIEALRDGELPLLRQLLTADEYRTVSDWWDAFLTDPALRAYRPCLLHGDLWYENILVDGAARSVAGVLDFGDAAVGDPAQDFASLLHLGERFTRHVLAAYVELGLTLGDDPGHRIQRYWELRELGGVQYALRFDQTELDDALRKLRSGPVLRGPGSG